MYMSRTKNLYSPYLNVDDVYDSDEDNIESMEKEASYFCETLMMFLVRSGLKRTAKTFWFDYSGIKKLEFKPEYNWQFGLYRSKTGYNCTEVQPYTGYWDELKEKARDVSAPDVPDYFYNDPLLLFAYSLTFPFRSTTSTMLYLDYHFGKFWFWINEPKGR